MTNDRFRYRIYDVENKKYVENPEDFVPWDLPDGFIAEQCTGVKDIDGVLIYVGDVLIDADTWDGVVWGAVFQDDDGQFICDDWGCKEWDTVRIVGNVHDNPEYVT